MELLKRTDVIASLVIAINVAGSQKKFAERYDISEQYVSDVLRGRREPGEKILEVLGYERVVAIAERTSPTRRAPLRCGAGLCFVKVLQDQNR